MADPLSQNLDIRMMVAVLLLQEKREFRRAVWGRRKGQLLATLMLSGWLLSAYGQDVAAGSPEIDDVSQRLGGLSYVGNFYQNGNQILACVRTKDGRYSYWNAATDQLSPEEATNCNLTHLYKRIYSSPPTEGFPSKHSAGFGDSGVVTEVVAPKVTPGINCTPNFGSYYRVHFPDKSENSFYVISKLRSAVEWDFPDKCQSGDPNQDIRPVWQKFDAAIGIGTLDLGNGKTLMSIVPEGWDPRLQGQVKLFVLRVPHITHPLFKNGFYIIPQPMLKDLASEDNPGGLPERYAEVVRVLTSIKTKH